MEIDKPARSNHCKVMKVINVLLTNFLIDGHDATKIKKVVEVHTLQEAVKIF